MPLHIHFIRVRARAYLIKQGIPFQELSTGHESFKAEVLPKGQARDNTDAGHSGAEK